MRPAAQMRWSAGAAPDTNGTKRTRFKSSLRRAAGYFLSPIICMYELKLLNVHLMQYNS
jgi:hypothetical protein